MNIRMAFIEYDVLMNYGIQIAATVAQLSIWYKRFMKPIYEVYENDIGTNKHDQRLVTKAIYFAIFPLTNWKVETDSA